MLLWKRYGNNKMAAMRYYVLHLQQYSHRLNLLYLLLLLLLLLLLFQKQKKIGVNSAGNVVSRTYVMEIPGVSGTKTHRVTWQT